MADWALALLIAIIIVGVVLLIFGGIAFFGYRAAFRPPSPRAIRRVAYASGAFAFFGFGFAAASVVFGQGVPWLVLVQCSAVLIMSAGLLRDPPIGGGRQSWDGSGVTASRSVGASPAGGPPREGRRESG